MGGVCRIGEFGSKISRSASAVRRGETEGQIVARRSPSGQRFFTDADVHAVLTPGFDSTVREAVAYCRVSSASQRADIANQRAAIVRTYSCRLNGLRLYEKSLKADDLTGDPA
jgi:putative resolvase